PRAYSGMASGRGLLSQVNALRQATAREAASGSAEARALLRRLTDTNRQLSPLLLDRAAPPAGRVAALVRERDELRRQLARALPRLDATRLERFDPDELCRLLPPGAAFLDLVRFLDMPTHTEVLKGAQRTIRYAALVVSAGCRASFVDLGEAAPIDRAVTAWRDALTSGAKQDAPAAEVARLVWRP